MSGKPHRRFWDWSDKHPGPYPRKYPADPKKGCLSVLIPAPLLRRLAAQAVSRAK